jgi:hypothetical protein
MRADGAGVATAHQVPWMDAVGAMLYGRATYELMESAGPALARNEKVPRATRAWWHKLEAKPK